MAACWWRPAPTICAASCYGYRWRHVIRPRILERAAARLEVAHLDRTPSHDTDDNLVAWCVRCHKKHDCRVLPNGLVSGNLRNAAVFFASG